MSGGGLVFQEEEFFVIYILQSYQLNFYLKTPTDATWFLLSCAKRKSPNKSLSGPKALSFVFKDRRLGIFKKNLGFSLRYMKNIL